ncbi:PadR family transcriptional regulator [Thermosediminibacter litoriperuensis]|uniref:Transcriptional regulator, PadR family n=1 Tax=Thermosediminibacter litoriperuensis TaxID=291989 RepID=A0A5S5AZE7_9FIRM|nr:helix-turn-helix transcriptional regulator [Thermosediminibacter litoriperuensis]TYP58831.1 transcriptional regulator, PadR family [Thermosediminibacter litoriperuensis]
MCGCHDRSHHRGGEPGCPGFKMEKFMQPCMLLLLYEKPAHGYELMEKLAEFGFGGYLDPGAVYRNLRKMEEEGWVRSDWETGESGPARRLYTITPEGEEAIHAWTVHIINQMGRLKVFIEKYEGLFRKKEDGK